MRARKVRDEVEARTMLREVARSNRSVATWCHENGVDGRSLNAWRMNLARGQGGRDVSDQPTLVELVVADGAPSARSLFRVHCGAFTVEFDGNVDAGTLSQVLRAVSTC